jgi:oligopeptide/dipeptide ABC transporter ATP-binding protein
VEQAPTEQLFRSPRHPYTRALLEAIPVPVPGAAADRRVLGGDIPSPANPPPGCRFHTRCPHAAGICRTERPVLRGNPAVSCHLADSLPAASTADRLTDRRSPAAEARFALYRRMTENNTTNKERLP